MPVSFGFHSSAIDPAAKEYIDFLKMNTFNTPVLALISCIFVNQLTEIPKDYFWDVVRRPIQFQKAIDHLEKRHECIYLDLGPSGTLANFTKHNLTRDSRSQCYSIMTPFRQELKNLMTIETLFRNPIFKI